MRLALAIALIALPAVAAAAEDRYGPEPMSPPASAAARGQSAPTPYSGRFLSWPGKTAPTRAAPPIPAPPQPMASIAPAPVPASLYTPPAPRPLPPPAARLALAAPSAPAAAPNDWVKSKFYSLHREYGDTPDPITLPVSRPLVLIGPADGAASVGDDADTQARDAKPKHPSDSDGIF